MTEWNAAEYSRHSSLQQAMADEVLALLHLSGVERILDIGCGDGKITAQIAQRLSEGSVVGVDPSHEMIRFAQSRFARPNLRFQVADARSLPFQQEFGLVVSLNALHWVPEQEKALRSIHCSLVSDGQAQIRLVPVGPRKSLEAVVEETRQAAWWKSYFADFTDPYLRLTPQEYSALAQRNGFRVLRLSTKDHAWDFGSRAAFADFSAIGCVAWTDRLPERKRMEFINEVLNRYQRLTGDLGAKANTFRFYQMDISLMAL